MIETHLSVEGTDTFTLRQAILIYESASHRKVLEMRKVIEGPEGPEYGPGKPANARSLVRALQDRRTRTLALVHPRLLASGEGAAIWWAPPTRRTPFFSSTCDLRKHTGRSVLMPGFVFHAQERRLRVRAFAGRGRPKPTTQLYHAPLWNVYDTGWVCMGSMPVPGGEPSACIEKWEEAFWNTAFTTPHHDHVCRHPKGYATMLRELRKARHVPASWLAPTPERVETWLK